MYIGTPSRLNTLLWIKSLLLTQSDVRQENIDKLNKDIHDEKVGLRNAYRERERHADGWEWHYPDYDEKWAIKKVDRIIDDEEWELIKEDEWQRWYNPYNDGRDCTGVWFSTTLERFVVGNKTFLYHRMSCDV